MGSDKDSMTKKIETLAQFYELMWETVSVRRHIVSCIFKEKRMKDSWVVSLERTREVLESLPEDNGSYTLKLTDDQYLHTELTYEIDELKKDLACLRQSEDTFFNYLAGSSPGFLSEVERGLDFLTEAHYTCFFTDRDGTVNNYCGRYKSSVQSIYNSLFLTGFAQDCTSNSVMLTSAPLENFGLLDLSIDPPGAFIYAGSKGREYIDRNGRRGSYAIGSLQQHKLDELNEALSTLLRKEEYVQYSLIGSGLQFKFGQTTVARQDIYETIPQNESEHFYKLVSGIVHDLDPEGTFFRMEDTGKDIEIILTIERDDASQSRSDFNKGDGVRFLNSDLDLKLTEGPNLICGDTSSDVAMVEASMDMTENTWAVFVTADESLKEQVRKVCANSYFVSSPDILITLLCSLRKRIIK
jgi:hypothetical protein